MNFFFSMVGDERVEHRLHEQGDPLSRARDGVFHATNVQQEM